MKIYISADIEGITGITHWDETEKSKPDYQKFAQQMTDEVKAACEESLLKMKMANPLLNFL